MNQITFTVTEDDLRMGIRKDCSWCPAARALKRKGYKQVTVDTTSVYVENVRFKTPNKLREFIVDFDNRALPPIKNWSLEDRTFTLG